MKVFGRKKIKTVFITLVLFMMLFTIGILVIQADNEENEPEIVTSIFRKIDTKNLGYTEEYQRWLSLSEYEGGKYIELNTYGTPYEESTNDTTGPTITITPNGNTRYAREQSATISVEDENDVNESTIRYVWTQNENQPDITEFENWTANNAKVSLDGVSGNNWYIWVMAKDLLGNVSYKRSNAFYLDNTIPNAPTITSNVKHNKYSKETAKVTISESTALSGIKKYQYSTNNGQDWLDVTDVISITESGIYKIIARAVSNTGIIGEESEEYIIKIDKNPPQVTGLTDGALYANVTPTITDETEMIAILSKNGEESLYNIDSENRGDTINKTGEYVLTVTDEAENKTVINFKIDADPPEITFTPNGNTDYKTSQSTKVTITDAHNIDETSLKYIWAQDIDYVSEYIFENGSTSFTNGETITKDSGSGNNYVLLVMARDELGNLALVKSEPFYIDNVGPSAPIITSNMGNGGITNGNITITIGGSSSPSGIKKYQYSLDGGNSWIDINEGETITFTEAGEYKLIARAINNLDIEGQVSEEFDATINKSVPVITFDPDGNSIYKKEQSTQINVRHTNTLNQESFKYLWTQSETIPDDSEFTEQFYFGSNLTKNTGSGAWYIWAKATDSLGNTAITRSKAFYLDNDTPTVPIINGSVPSDKATNESVTVSFNGSESASGIKKYKYSLDNQYTWIDISENKQIEFQYDGIYTIYAVAVNNVGTTGEVTEPYIVKIDKTPPKITGVEDGETYQKVTPIIEGDSEVEIKLIKDDVEIPYEEGDEINEKGDYTITITDEVGNETVINFSIDNIGPTITFNPNGNNTYAKEQSTIVTITDDSGIDESTVRYKWTQSIQVLTEETFMPDSVPFSSGDTITKNTESGNNWYLWILAKDTKGNMSLVKSMSFYLDNEIPTAPTIEASVESGAYTRDNVTINITGSSSPSGIAKYQYSVDNGKTWEDLNVGETLTIDTSGIYPIKARAVNSVGTEGIPSDTYTVKIDKNGPIITFTPNGNTTYAKQQSTTVNVNSIESLNTLKYIWSTQEEGIEETDFKITFTNNKQMTKNTESGTWYLWVLAKDNQNNQTITRSDAFLLDNEIPTEPILEMNAEKNSSISKTLEIQISGSSSPSGIAKYQYSLNNGSTWIDVPIGQKVYVNSIGSYKIKARAVNNVGTLGTETESYDVTVCQATIDVAFVPKENETYSKEHSTHVIIETNDELTKLKYVWSTKEDDVQESEITQDFTNKQTIVKNTESGTWYLWIFAEDNLGNKIIKKSGKFNFDNGIPTAPIINKEVEEGGEKVTIQLSGSTSLSGIAKYQYSLNDGITWNDLAVGENLILNEMGDYRLKARAVNNVGTLGTQTETQEISIKTKIPTITFTPNGNDSYQNIQSTKIEVSSNYEIIETSLKYIWSTKAEGITENDILSAQDATEEIVVSSYKSGQIITKNTDSGIWYIWAYSENTNGDTKLQRSEAFYLDNDLPIIEGVESGKVYNKEVTPVITDKTSTVSIEVMKDGTAYQYIKGNSIKDDGVYQITAIDEAGNSTNVIFTMQYKEDDTIGPMVVFTPNENKKYKREQSTKVEVEDPSGVNEEILKYLWSKSKEQPNEEDFIESFKNGETITNNKDTGKLYLWIYAEDVEGNKSIIRSNEFYLDNTKPNKPTITSNVEDGDTTDQNVVINISGGKVESEVHYEYSLDGGETWQIVDENTITFTEEGDQTVQIIAVNETEIRSDIVEFSFTIKKEEQNQNKNQSQNHNNTTLDEKLNYDNTTAKGILPQTGSTPILLVCIIVFVGVSIITFVKIIRNYK